MSKEQPYMGPPPMAPPPSYAQATGAPYPAGFSAPYVPGPAPPPGAVPPEQAIVTTVVPLGPQSTRMTCPHCHFEISTSTKTEPGIIAYISGALIALFG